MNSNLVDLPPFFGALVGKSFVEDRHDLVENLTKQTDKHIQKSRIETI